MSTKPGKKFDLYDLLYYIPLAAALLFLGSCPYRWFLIEWKFARLEQNTRKVMSGDDLQKWATNLLTKGPWDQSQMREFNELQKQIPKELLELWVSRPHLSIHEEAYYDQPSHLHLYWGSGVMGHSGFEIGPTNFAGNCRPNMTEWQPGVYFFHPR